jgi:hypothetical protein
MLFVGWLDRSYQIGVILGMVFFLVEACKPEPDCTTLRPSIGFTCCPKFRNQRSYRYFLLHTL